MLENQVERLRSGDYRIQGGSIYTMFEGERTESETHEKAMEYETSPALVLFESCPKYNDDKRLIGKGHVVNFISNDCISDSQIALQIHIAHV